MEYDTRNEESQYAEISFALYRDNFKTIRITVCNDGSILVKAPVFTSLEEISEFVFSKEDWIAGKRAQLASQTPPPEFAFRDGEELFFLGRPFRIVFNASQFAAITFKGSSFIFSSPETEIQSRRRSFLRWRLHMGNRILSNRLLSLSRDTCHILHDNAMPSSITIRSLKSRWGSCSSIGRISLAVQLLDIPLHLQDAVILHELCHLREMNHGPAFHALLQQLDPDEIEHRRQIHAWRREHPFL